MKRELFTLVSALSLALCLTTLVIWVGGLSPVLAIGNHYTTIDAETYDGLCVSLWKYKFDVQATSRIDRPFVRFSGDGWLVELS